MIRRSIRRILVAGISAATLLAAASAQAQLFRAYVSSAGNDANPCTLPQPCRLLPAALAAVASNGEIWMVDSANYNTGPVVVNKSVTILAVPGVIGSVVGNNGTALSIQAAGIQVTLRNLVIRDFSLGDVGVLIGNAASVTIENCEIFGFVGPTGSNGLAIWANTGANAVKVSVVGSIIRNNFHGIVAAGNASVTVSKSHILANGGVGIWSNAGSGITVVHVIDSVASANATGFAASGNSGTAHSYMYLTRAVASENVNQGFATTGGITAFMVVGDSMATNNGSGFNNGGGAGTFRSRGDNTVIGNAADVVGTITPQGGV